MKQFISQLRQSDAIILDTETTGLDNNAEILQIGIASLEGESLFTTYVKPAKAKRWDDAMRVHSISPSDVKDAPAISQLSEELKQIMHGRLVAIYNADFDTRMLRQSVKADKATGQYQWLQSQQWRCVMKAYAAYWGQRDRRYGSYKWQSLTNACRQQGIRVTGAHDALGDARLTAALIGTIEKLMS